MSDIFDYIEEKKDKTFSELDLTEVDNVIFSRLSYLELNDYKGKTLKEISELYNYTDKDDNKIFAKTTIRTEELLEAVAKTKRFENVVLIDFKEIASVDFATAFYGCVFKLFNGKSFIAFRGTDDKIMSFYEDAELAYSFPIPSQIAALQYVRTVSKKCNDDFYIGGHSKGGNLALFSYVFLNQNLKNRIVKVFNNDGPGFPKELVKILITPEMSQKIDTIVPESSIVGRMLDTSDEFVIIKSDSIGASQHNVFTWNVIDDKFERAEKFSILSELMENTLTESLENISSDDIKNAAQTIYKIAVKSGIESTDDINISNLKSILDTLIEISKAEKDGSSDISLIIKILIKSLFNSMDMEKIMSYGLTDKLENLKEVMGYNDFKEFLTKNVKDSKYFKDLKEAIDNKDYKSLVDYKNLLDDKDLIDFNDLKEYIDIEQIKNFFSFDKNKFKKTNDENIEAESTNFTESVKAIESTESLKTN